MKKKVKPRWLVNNLDCAIQLISIPQGIQKKVILLHLKEMKTRVIQELNRKKKQIAGILNYTYLLLATSFPMPR